MLHEQEQERLMQERMRAEQLDSALKEFHAQPNLSKYGLLLTFPAPLKFLCDLYANREFSSTQSTWPA